MKKKILLIASTMYFIALNAAAQTGPNLSGGANGFLNGTVKPLFPIVLGIVFIVTALFNIGEVTGDQKNYKSFFSKIGIFVGSVIIIRLVLQWILSQSV